MTRLPSSYDYLWPFLFTASLVPALAVAVSRLLAPASKAPERRISYESGIEPMGGAWVQFQVRYYMFALVFVVFDVETIFLYPWAASLNRFGVAAFIEGVIFVLVLVIGLVYAWRKGALEWF